jgi:hypothetical protein
MKTESIDRPLMLGVETVVYRFKTTPMTLSLSRS